MSKGVERYGIAIGEPAPHTNAQRTVICAIEVLNEYQNHSIVFRRKKSKDENYPVQFAKLFLDFYDYNLKRGLAPGTLRQFSIYTRKFARYLDHRSIAYFSEVTAADIQGFILTLAPYSKHSVAYAMTILRGLLTFAHENGYHQQNLSPTCPKIRYNSKSAIPSAFSDDVVQKLLSAVDRGSPLGKIDVFVFRQDKRLVKIIGEALHLISADRIEEGLSSFYANTGIISAKEFDYRISELLPKGENKDTFLIIECGEEVEILRFLMRNRMQEWFGSGTYHSKLAYLMFLLDTEEAEYQQQKRELICELLKKDR